jgi:hypothetical protein
MSEDYEYEMEIFLDPDAPGETEDDETAQDLSARRRLQNLGYGTGEPLNHQVSAFQRDCGLPETGTLQDIADRLNQCHEQYSPPLRIDENGPS